MKGGILSYVTILALKRYFKGSFEYSKSTFLSAKGKTMTNKRISEGEWSALWCPCMQIKVHDIRSENMMFDVVCEVMEGL